MKNENNSQPQNAAPFSIGAFSVKNPVLINILMVTLLVLGVFSVSRMPQEQFAEVPFFWVNIIVPYPGVSAADVEETVTIPIENEFQGIDQLKRIQSTSSEGLSVVRVEFDDGISNQEFNRLYQDAQTRFNRVELPDDILEPVVDDFSSADFLPVIEVIISGNLPYQKLREKTLRLRDKLIDVKDVSGVDLVGLKERQIILDIHSERLEALGMTTGELIRAVQSQNTTVPGGTITTEGREYLIRTIGNLKDLDNLSSIIVRRSSENQEGMVRVNQIADVIDGFDPESPISRFNGETAISLRITKEPRGSSIDVVNGTKQTVENFKSEIPEGMSISLFNDSTVQIKDSINVLVSNAFFGLALLLGVLWLFIGFRNAAMTALGIPVAFAITFMVLEALGETINTNTLFGLVLVLGLIVDHAIVIIENSYRLNRKGFSRHNAAIIGTNKVVLPVIAATATTVAAFLPLMLIPGTIGKFLRVIPLTVTVALIASTVEALFILPSHYADWGKERKNKTKDPGKWFDAVQNFYTKLFRKIYRFKKLVITGMLLILIGSFALINTLNQDLFAAEDYSYFTIDISLPPGAPLYETDKVVKQYEKKILSMKGNSEIVAVRSSIGSTTSSTGSSTKSNTGQIVVDIAEMKEGRTRPIDAILAEVQNQTSNIPGPEEVLFRKAVNGPPTSAPVNFRLSGNDYSELVETSEIIQEWLSEYSELFNIEDNYQPGSPELRVLINPERASALGINPATIGRYIRARFDGIPVGTFFENNEEIEIILRFDYGGIQNYDTLAQMKIPTQDGRLIPFSTIGRIEPDISVASIRRIDGKRQITITAQAYNEERLPVINEEIPKRFNTELASTYPDVELISGGEFSEFQDLIIDILRVFLIGLFLIYLILGSQFNSYSQPFIILFSIPFAFVGVIGFLFVSGTPFSTTILYAGVALAGIAVNDAIVLVSFINDLRKEGKPVAEAIKEASVTRLRPIVLTSVSTIMGLVPTAIGIGGRSVVWGPMASTIIFGLIFSTITSLIIIPALYGIIYDRKKKGNNMKNKKKTAESGLQNTKGITSTSVIIFTFAILFSFFSPGNADAQENNSLIKDYPMHYDLSQETRNTLQLLYKTEGQSLIKKEGIPYTEPFRQLREVIRKQNPEAVQLASMTSIAEAQLQAAKKEVYPGFSLTTDAQRSPLYGYSRSKTQNFSDPTAQPEITHTHTFGMSGQINQKLPTGGNTSLLGTTRFSATYGEESETQTWQLNPSMTLQITQPFLTGKGVIDTNLAARKIEDANIGQKKAETSLTAAIDTFALQIANLQLQKQNLENRLELLKARLQLQENSLEESRSNFTQGRIAADQLQKQETELLELSQEIRNIEYQILQNHINISKIVADPSLPAFFPKLPQQLPLVSNDFWKKAKTNITASSADVINASRDLRQAEIQLAQAGIADAPQAGVSLQLQPRYPDNATYDNMSDSVTGFFDENAGLNYHINFFVNVRDFSRVASTQTVEIAEAEIKRARSKLEATRRQAQQGIVLLEAEYKLLSSQLTLAAEQAQGAQSDLEQAKALLETGTSSEAQVKSFTINRNQTFAELKRILRQMAFVLLQTQQKSTLRY